MTKDELIKLIVYTNLDLYAIDKDWDTFCERVELFAEQVAKHEREACAKLCDDLESDEAFVANIAEIIRARGQK
jgi:hypothetical protein